MRLRGRGRTVAEQPRMKSGIFFGYSTVHLLSDLADDVTGRLVKCAFAWYEGREVNLGGLNDYERAIWGMMRKELEENWRRYEAANKGKSEGATRRWAREKAEDSVPPELALDGDARRRPTVRFDKDRCVFEGITEEDLRVWGREFPTLDVAEEVRGLERWFRDNPAKRWRKNIRGHIGNCLAGTARRLKEREDERRASGRGGAEAQEMNTRFDIL